MKNKREQYVHNLREQLVLAKDMSNTIAIVHELIRENDTVFRQYCKNFDMDESWDFLASMYSANLNISDEHLIKFFNDYLFNNLDNNTADVDLSLDNTDLLNEFLQSIAFEGVNQIFKVFFLGEEDLLNLPHKVTGKISNAQCKKLYFDTQKIESEKPLVFTIENFSKEKILMVAALLNVKGEIEKLLVDNIDTTKFKALSMAESKDKNLGRPKSTLFNFTPQRAIEDSEVNPCCCVMF